MSDAPSSPKRRHILSSINPHIPSRHDILQDALPRRDRRSRAKSPSCASRDRFKCHDGEQSEKPSEKQSSQGTRLRLKKHKHSHGHHRDREESSSRRRRRHGHRRTSAHSPGPNSPGSVPGPQPLDAETAFRESLFDAMADDEGAAYWEHVYGQPIHVYPKEKVGPTGDLERMTDDEYAAHVRQKMYKKTHAGLIEEQNRRLLAQEAKESEERKRRAEWLRGEDARRHVRAQMEASLRRGEVREKHKHWERLWSEYAEAWIAWDGNVATLPWPVKRRKPGAIAEDEVRAFFRHGIGLDDMNKDDLAMQLKQQRVRWHPDKMQQRLGGQVDQDVIRDVTVVFQIIDSLWEKTRISKR